MNEYNIYNMNVTAIL